MRVLLGYILAILALLFSFDTIAQQSVNERLDAASDSIVEIEHMNGEAVIIGWDRDEVEVVGTLGEDTEEFIFERKGKTIKIEVKVEKSNWNNWNNSYEGDDLTIKVPNNARVKYESINAEVSVSQVYGGSDIEVINGTVTVDDLTGKIVLESVNGDIEATNLRGELNIQAVNGDIEISHSEGEEILVTAVNGDIEFVSTASDAKVETVNGDMEVTFSMVEDLTLDTVNGSIDATMSLHEGATVRASSVSGSIDLAFDADVEAKFDIEAHAGGRIRNNLTGDKPNKAEYGPRRWLEFSKGSPDASVRADTVNGRVTLNKK